jgi:hypothetical protein
MARQNILDRKGAPQLWCILDEVAEHPRTTIQVIRSGGAHAGLLGGFIIADLDSKPSVADRKVAEERWT